MILEMNFNDVPLVIHEKCQNFQIIPIFHLLIKSLHCNFLGKQSRYKKTFSLRTKREYSRKKTITVQFSPFLIDISENPLLGMFSFQLL